MRTLPILFCILFFLVQQQKICNAQSEFPVMAMKVSTVDVGNNFTVDSLPSLTDTTIFETSMQLDLYDTLDIQSIEVKIGTSSGASDIFIRSFIYDVSGSLGGGITYLRNGYQISLGLGKLMHMLNYFSEVRVYKSDGNYSVPVVFNRSL